MPSNTEELTSKMFWQRHAPDFNFEMGEDRLLAEGLYQDYIRKIGDDLYEYVNPTGTEGDD
jgi:hypothetical protein